MKNKQYAVLGLGVFGSTVATTLAKYDCEVLQLIKMYRVLKELLMK